jgi:prophage antirepressor-like protein
MSTSLIEQFNFKGANIEILLDEHVDIEFVGDFLMNANQVAKILGYEDLYSGIRRNVNEEDKYLIKNSDLSNRQFRNLNNRGENFINESGMYALIFGSTLDVAQEFKHWVTSEVLPEIRKTGSYVVDGNNKPANLYDGLRQMVDKLEEVDETANRALEGAKLSFRQQQKIEQKLKKEKEELDEQIEILKKRITNLDPKQAIEDRRKAINKMVRKYGFDYCDGDIAKAWNIFVKRFNDKHSTNLKKIRTHLKKNTGEGTIPGALEKKRWLQEGLYIADTMLNEDE